MYVIVRNSIKKLQVCVKDQSNTTSQRLIDTMAKNNTDARVIINQQRFMKKWSHRLQVENTEIGTDRCRVPSNCYCYQLTAEQQLDASKRQLIAYMKKNDYPMAEARKLYCYTFDCEFEERWFRVAANKRARNC